jgi:hypothetical protein
MLSVLRRILGYQMTIAEWIGTALMVGIPYAVIGIIWSAAHALHLNQMHGIDRLLSWLGSIAAWPVLLLSNVCMT